MTIHIQKSTTIKEHTALYFSLGHNKEGTVKNLLPPAAALTTTRFVGNRTEEVVMVCYKATREEILALCWKLFDTLVGITTITIVIPT